MNNYIQILSLVTIGVFLLWFGYSLLIGQFAGLKRELLDLKRKKKFSVPQGTPGEPQVCPVCATKLSEGYMVKTQAFPSLTGGKDRLMHIRGCVYCIDGSIPRICPVCREQLCEDQILVARMFERPRRNHVHVLGCSNCTQFRGIMQS